MLIRSAKDMTLKLIEKSTWTGMLYELIIADGVASFKGFDIYADRFPTRIQIRDDSLKILKNALNFLEMPNWKELYRPEDIGSVIDDGGSWQIEFNDILYSGENAYPSYESASVTSLYEGRLGLLRESIFSILSLNIPFSSHNKPN